MGNFPEQVYGKTGTAQYNAGQAEATTPGIHASCRRPRPASRSWSRLGREGRLRRRRRGAGRPADPVAVVPRQARPLHQRQLDRPVSATTPITPAEQTRRAARPLAARVRSAAAAGGAGAAACSFLTLRDAVGSSEADKQALYGGVGRGAGAGDQPDRLLATARVQARAYAVMIALNLVVYGFAAVAGARRWIPLPGFSFQSSEFGKLLLIVALAGFAVDRSRQLNERRTTARIMLLALIAALLVIPSRTSARDSCTCRSGSRSCSSPGPRGSTWSGSWRCLRQRWRWRWRRRRCWGST